MPNQPPHDELLRQLRRQGLPHSYIERLIAELNDHYCDLLEERSSSMGAARKLQHTDNESSDLQQRLGEPAQLALFAAEQYHSRTFWGRHPVVTYLLAPLPLLVAMFTGYVVSLLCVGYCLQTIGNWVTDWQINEYEHPYAQAMFLTLLIWGALVMPPILSALVLCRVYRRNALSIRWPIIGCAVLSLVMAVINTDWRLATGIEEGQRGMIMVGFYASTSIRAILGTYLPRFALAFAIGLLLVRRAKQQLAVAL
jgi:glucan phosphoethanolaminetransferase (alkaline phosphatase superfamily)